jgi:hypothetical protein
MPPLETIRKSCGYKLRVLFKDMPPSLVPQPEEPKRLTEDDAWDNYRFVVDDPKADPTELVHRVRKGLKPMGTLVIKNNEKIYLTVRSVRETAKALNMRHDILYTRGGRREVVWYLDKATLAHFYDPAEVIERYKAAGITLPRDVFDSPLSAFARAVTTGEVANGLGPVIVGLCLGYPIQATLELMQKGKPT